MRTAELTRNTLETQITLSLNLDGRGESTVDTGCGFLNHMLTLFARHGRFDLKVVCHGDRDVDDHHTVEDVGICLGTAFKEALGDCRGICRYGSTTLPMDEALILSAVDISGRGMLRYHLDLPTEKVGTFDTELGEEFWLAFTRCAGMTLHLRQLDGTNSHHILEGAFKSVARSLRAAVAVDPAARDEIPSTKGVL
ncbi:MAG TPA: imidazoleglycerol-phosphate dehydratase HisB [Candidatus Avoscillospira stercorigallinarum]|uniref:Imidazoleglycerol-phosphate dehydratase n=1 Tax=Candidatus Avoscillospira stercorigallinarum TaxID=2840708 RepID=A0A9D0Z6Q4_9FIRM|nr:imidazoleglycerol-phosphate dehydratase HisB [Candidatus Avoscillospira stercorigallinarum]